MHRRWVIFDAGDYSLQSTSPAIDAGDPALIDADGSRLNIGAPFDVASRLAAPVF